MRQLAKKFAQGIEQSTPGTSRPLSGSIAAWRQQAKQGGVAAASTPTVPPAPKVSSPAKAAASTQATKIGLSDNLPRARSSSPSPKGASVPAAPSAKPAKAAPAAVAVGGAQARMANLAAQRLADAKAALETSRRSAPSAPSGASSTKPSASKAGVTKMLEEARKRDAARCIRHSGAGGGGGAAANPNFSRMLEEARERDRARSLSSSDGPRKRTGMAGLLEGYGAHTFKGAVADQYLQKVGLPAGTVEKAEWHKDKATSDLVAQAVQLWATDNGASIVTHWFQPLGSSGVRHGQTAQVHNAFFNFDKSGTPTWNLKGKDLIQGETDGSSYPTGGLRATHTAGGYLTVDPTSPMWLRGDTVFVPSAFVSYHGHAIDEKTPLLRSVEAMNREGKRLLSLLGYEVPGLQSCIGLEQEFFLIDRKAYMKRPDLQMAGRTLIGMDAPRGQEMCDHYMGPPSMGTNPALACMQEVQRQCYNLGIPLKTRHREVAPNQYEHAPYFGTVTTQIDQNLIVMQILEEVASGMGLACLMHEKPFSNVNGSGKHNNWSLITDCGVNLFNQDQVTKASGNAEVFPAIMSAVIAAIDQHGDLLRMAIACPGNDFRLGACEAPPAILSTYLGQSLSDYMKDYRDGKGLKKKASKKSIDLGASCFAKIEVPAEDRNRTSPFPYGGHRFEFRAVGSSQNVSMVNTALNTMVANQFKKFADVLQGGNIRPHLVASNWLDKHWKCIFNGDNYGLHWQEMLTNNGVWRIDSGVEAMCRFTDPKNTSLFASMGVLSQEECAARQDVMLEHYVGTVEIEAKCMIRMINQLVIPAVREAGVGPDIAALQEAVSLLGSAMSHIHQEPDLKTKAQLSRMLRLEDMVQIRELTDQAEEVVPADLWTLATYQELLFLDVTN